MKQIKVNSFFIAIVHYLILPSCGIPKHTQQRINSGHKQMIDLPVDYCNVFPTPTYEQWDKDYDSYNRFLTRDIMRTQMGLAFENNGVRTSWCMPSVRVHVQLDTTTMITDSKMVIGDWRITCNRRIMYLDSAVYADKKVYRNSKIIYDEKDADVFLVLTDNKFKMYGTEKGRDNFKKGVNKNYHIENKRFLMLYGISKSTAAMSFIGMDKEGRLIINSYNMVEREMKGVYIVYQATMTQMVFKRAL